MPDIKIHADREKEMNKSFYNRNRQMKNKPMKI